MDQTNMNYTMATSQLRLLVDDKLWMRLQAAKVGVAVPRTLAFPFRARLRYDDARCEAISVVHLTQKDGVSDVIRTAVRSFVDSPSVRRFRKVSVSGGSL